MYYYWENDVKIGKNFCQICENIFEVKKKLWRGSRENTKNKKFLRTLWKNYVKIF